MAISDISRRVLNRLLIGGPCLGGRVAGRLFATCIYAVPGFFRAAKYQEFLDITLREL